MNLPLVEVYERVYENWIMRDASKEEMMVSYQKSGRFEPYVKDRLANTVSNPIEAATYILSVGADNGLGGV